MEELGLGILIGMGLIALGRRVVGRSAVKNTIKAGLVASEAAMNAIHESKEMLSDLVAEARHEAAIERSAAAAGEVIPPPVDPSGKTSN